MSDTQVTTDQVVFKSVSSGDTTLDTYLEACERGGRSLPSLMEDLFDGSGNPIQDIELRESPITPGQIQFRVGTFVDPNAGWADIPGDSFPDVLADCQSAATAAAGSATAASGSATTASTAATTATNIANSFYATSTTSNSISIASKTFTTQSSKAFTTGNAVIISLASDPSNFYMSGVVTAYSGTSLTVNVSNIKGSGTLNNWLIKLSGIPGATGPAGPGSGNMLGSQNLNDVASKPTSFDTIKQAATASYTGVVELATDAETITGTDTTRATTPANIKAYYDAKVTPWVAYTPTFTGFGTPTGVEFYSRRVGDSLEVKWKFTSGTSTAVEARVSLGFNGVDGGITTSSTKIPSGTSLAGVWYVSASSAVSPTILAERAVGYMTFGTQDASSSGLTKKNGSTFISSGQTLSGFASFPINGW